MALGEYILSRPSLLVRYLPGKNNKDNATSMGKLYAMKMFRE